MEIKISDKLLELKVINQIVEENTNKANLLRTEILEDLQKNGLKQYKDDVATVSYVSKKSLKIEDESKLISSLPEQYIEIVPEQKTLNKKFYQEAKDGIAFEGVTVEEKEFPNIRFN